jgi:hypothetical protein
MHIQQRDGVCWAAALDYGRCATQVHEYADTVDRARIALVDGDHTLPLPVASATKHKSTTAGWRAQPIILTF